MKRLCASNKIEENSISSTFHSGNDEEEDIIHLNPTEQSDLASLTALSNLSHGLSYKIDALLLENVRNLEPARFLPATETAPNYRHGR